MKRHSRACRPRACRPPRLPKWRQYHGNIQLFVTSIMSRLHAENHLVSRIGWLRAAVLGANDGIVSTASLIIGVAAAGSAHHEIVIAGVAGLIAGAASMA